MNIEELLSALLERKASDLHLKVGRPPLFRIFGKLVPTEFPVVSEEDIKSGIYELLRPEQIQKFEQKKELDFAFHLKGRARFRVNIFLQKSKTGAVFRAIPLKVPTLEELKFPPVMKDIALKNAGLILVTGPTGSGKSTTLVAMLQQINGVRPCHVMTVEDPIEFVLADNVSVINQREVGLDTESFGEALRHILRQDPDVIVIGEMRDLETTRIAISAAETGHLVFATLHTNDAKQSIDRVVDIFPATQQDQVRLQLSRLLNAIISQRLLSRKDGLGRIAAIEIMVNSPMISKLIADNNVSQITRTIEQSATFYRMQSLNQSLAMLCKQNLINLDDALTVSSSPDELKMVVKGIQSGAGYEDYKKAQPKLEQGFPLNYKCPKCNRTYEIKKPGTYKCQCGEQFTIPEKKKFKIEIEP